MIQKEKEMKEVSNYFDALEIKEGEEFLYKGNSYIAEKDSFVFKSFGSEASFLMSFNKRTFKKNDIIFYKEDAYLQ